MARAIRSAEKQTNHNASSSDPWIVAALQIAGWLLLGTSTLMVIVGAVSMSGGIEPAAWPLLAICISGIVGGFALLGLAVLVSMAATCARTSSALAEWFLIAAESEQGDAPAVRSPEQLREEIARLRGEGEWPR